MEIIESSKYLTCENRFIFALLMCSSGMMGAYTFSLRGGVFCNAQTANFVMMAVAFGNGKWGEAFYFLIPITAYFLGSFISEILPNPIKKIGLFRWDTWLIGFEAVILFVIGFIPLTVSDHLVQVLINFIASMQYNTFRQAEGIPMATTFCTNHVRQIGIAFAKASHKKDTSRLKRAFVHMAMIMCFLGSGIILAYFCNILYERAIWIAVLPMMICFITLAYADLTKEHKLLHMKPHGH